MKLIHVCLTIFAFSSLAASVPIGNTRQSVVHDAKANERGGGRVERNTEDVSVALTGKSEDWPTADATASQTRPKRKHKSIVLGKAGDAADKLVFKKSKWFLPGTIPTAIAMLAD